MRADVHCGAAASKQASPCLTHRDAVCAEFAVPRATRDEASLLFLGSEHAKQRLPLPGKETSMATGLPHADVGTQARECAVFLV